MNKLMTQVNIVAMSGNFMQFFAKKVVTCDTSCTIPWTLASGTSSWCN